jgi:dihydropyrimidinase
MTAASFLAGSRSIASLSARTLHMKVDCNPYEGRDARGAVDTVVSRGRVVIDAGVFTGRAGGGSLLKRSAR